MIWVLVAALILLASLLAGRVLFRRYQDFRIRQHRHQTAWRAYKQSKGGPR